jgi:nucleoside-diphosphate-sugar epimerase
MRILIAGGAGYVGSALAPKLAERGYESVVVDTLWFGNHLPEDIEVRQKGVFDLTEDDLRGFDQVIFLAGVSNDPMAEYSPGHNFVANAAAPAYLGYIAKRAGVRRLVSAGSCSVYGYTVNELYDETSPAISSYPYGISKLQGENAVLQMVDDSFSVIALRKGTVCGFSPRMRLDLIVNTMFKTALRDNQITVNNPEIWRPIISIQDTVTAYIRAVEAHQSISGVFNVASGNYTVGEVGGIVKDVLDAALGINVKLNILHKDDVRNYKVSIDKAIRVLSFKPKHDVESITEDLLANRDSFSDFDNPAYYNIEVFKSLEGDLSAGRHEPAAASGA